MPKLIYTANRVRIETPFSRPFVDALKAAVPGGYRNWQAYDKSWVVYQPYVAEARRLVKTYYSGVEEQGYAEFTAQEEEREQARQRAEQEARERASNYSRRGFYQGNFGRQEQETRRLLGWEEDEARGRRRAKYSDGTFGPWIDDPNVREQARRREEHNQRNQRHRQDAGDDFSDFFGRRRAGGSSSGSGGSSGSSGSYSTSDPYATLYVLPSAPEHVIRAAYKALAIALHPDRNRAADATEQMQRVNAAFDAVKRAKGWS